MSLSDARKMSAKEQFDGCMRQAEFLSQKMYSRQTYQWKVTIGLWTLLAISVAFLAGKKISMPWWLVGIVLVPYAFIWLRGISIRNYDDRRRANHFRDNAEMLLVNDSHSVETSPPTTPAWTLRWCFHFLSDWSHLFELISTGVLICAAYWILAQK